MSPAEGAARCQFALRIVEAASTAARRIVAPSRVGDLPAHIAAELVQAHRGCLIAAGEFSLGLSKLAEIGAVVDAANAWLAAALGAARWLTERTSAHRELN